MAELEQVMGQSHRGATTYRYCALAVMMLAWFVGILQLMGYRF